MALCSDDRTGGEAPRNRAREEGPGEAQITPERARVARDRCKQITSRIRLVSDSKAAQTFAIQTPALERLHRFRIVKIIDPESHEVIEGLAPEILISSVGERFAIGANPFAIARGLGRRFFLLDSDRFTAPTLSRIAVRSERLADQLVVIVVD